MFFVGLAMFFCFLGLCQRGVPRYVLLAAAAMFVILYLAMLVSRLTVSRTLELTEDGIFKSRHGLCRGRVHFAFSNVIRLAEANIRDHVVLHVFTKDEQFEICSAYFEDSNNYSFVRGVICTRSGIDFPPDTPIVMGWREVPPPLLHWTEPDDWPGYRASLVAAKPLFPRAAKTLWFSIRCFAIIMTPRLLLHFAGLADGPFWGYFTVALAFTAFLTFLYWYSRANPARITKIVFRTDRLTFFSGKQTANIKYDQFSGWNIVERQFEGHPLFILLLKSPRWLGAHALACAEDRQHVAKILEAQKIPTDPSLRPSWE